MADLIYNSFTEDIGDGTIDLDTDTLKICLLDNGHTPSAAHSQYSDVSVDELAAGGGYSTGGATLAGVTWAQSGGTCKLDAIDPAWAAATFTARYAVIYSDTAAGKELICLIDFGADKTATATTFTILFHASGIFDLAAA